MKEETQIILYQPPEGQITLEVNLREETLWLSQKQMTLLFNRERSVITKHIRNVFAEGELEQNRVCANFAHTAKDGKTYEVEHYNLDVVISVGYRVKSKQGTLFRIWATNVLRDYLVEGFVVNQKRLAESEEKYLQLQKLLNLAANVSEVKELSASEATGILKVLQHYAYALETLDKYDHQQLTIEAAEDAEKQELTYPEAIELIREWRSIQGGTALFGNEKDESFKSSLESIYQTFGGVDLYPGIEEKDIMVKLVVNLINHRN